MFYILHVGKNLPVVHDAVLVLLDCEFSIAIGNKFTDADILQVVIHVNFVMVDAAP